MAQLAISLAGAAIGSFFGMPQLGFVLGSAIGSLVVGQQKPKGPRASDYQVQVSTYGQSIFKVWGQMRLAGDLIWIGERKKKKKEISAKGMFGGSGTYYYTYRQSFAVGLCEPVKDVLKVWFNTKLVYDKTGDSKVYWKHKKAKIRFYYGGAANTPDPLIEAERGIDRTPAFKHLCYMVVEDLSLTNYNNQLPSVRALVVTKSSGEKMMGPPISGFTSPRTSGLPPLMIDSMVPDRRPGQPYAYLESIFGWPKDTFLYKIDVSACKIAQEAQVAYTWGSFGPGDTMGGFLYFNANNVDPATGKDNNTTHGRTSMGAFTLDGLIPPLIGGVQPPKSEGPMPSGRYRANQYTGEIYHAAETDLYHSRIDVFGAGGWKYKVDYGPENEWADGPPIFRDFDGDSAGEIFLLLGDASSFQVLSGVLSMGSAVRPNTEVPGARLLRWVPIDNSLVIASSAKAIKVDIATRQIVKRLTFPNLIHSNNTSFHQEITAENTIWLASSKHDSSIAVPSGAVPIFPRFFELDLVTLTIKRDETFTEAAAYYPVQGNHHFAASNALYYPEYNTIIAQEESGFVIGCFHFGTAGGCESLKDVIDEMNTLTGQLNVATQTDTAALAGDQVCGYTWEQRKPIREAQEDLATTHFFNAREVDGKIQYLKRNSVSILTIPEADLGAHEEGESSPEVALRETRQQQIEVPKEVALLYIDEDRSWEQGTAEARRDGRTVSTSDRSVVNVPEVFSFADAQKVVNTISRELWQQRTDYEFALPPPYQRLDPMDPVTIALENGYQHKVRLEEATLGANGILECKATQVDPAIYQDPPDYNTGGGGFISPVIDIPVPSALVVMDLPYLRDVDDGQSVYMAAGPNTTIGATTWDSALLYRSVDHEQSWQDFSVFDTAATIGTALTALGTPAAWTTWDETNTVDVQLNNGILFNATSYQVLNLGNAAVLGDEIIQFRTATLLDADLKTYRLSGLTRGRRGTDWAIGTHRVGDAFVLLDGDSIERINLPLTDLSVQRDYRAATAELSIEESTNVPFTWQARSLKPYSVTMIQGARDGSNNLTISWLRRSRVGVSWQSGQTPALNEASEAYEIDVVVGGVVVRTLTSTTSSASYSAANQTADGITPGDQVRVRVYQLSAVVGRGFPAEATI